MKQEYKDKWFCEELHSEKYKFKFPKWMFEVIIDDELNDRLEKQKQDRENMFNLDKKNLAKW